MEDMLKELEKLTKELGDFREKFNPESEEYKERKINNLKKAKKAIIESLNSEDPECIMFVTNQRITTSGTVVETLSLLSSVIDKFANDNDIPLDLLVKAFIFGTCVKDGQKVDHDKIEEVLDSIKELI